MPYPTLADLPDSLRRRLPPHAQAIYRGAFNSAWDPDALGPDRDAIANRVAWAAVKRRYRKRGDAWVPIANREHP